MLANAETQNHDRVICGFFLLMSPGDYPYRLPQKRHVGQPIL